MKIPTLIFYLALLFSFNHTRAKAASGYTACRSISNDSLPELNQQVLDFVKSKMKKKVGRGECWDLAAQALNAAHASWNGKLKYGRLLNPDNEEILPGDIIQFEGVKLRFEKNGLKYTEVMKHHTAIVYSVLGDRRFEIAHQNTSQWGRKVWVSELNLDELVKGKCFIYRPVK